MCAAIAKITIEDGLKVSTLRTPICMVSVSNAKHGSVTITRVEMWLTD